MPSRGYMKCPRRDCRNGWVEEFEIATRGRLRKSGQHKCTLCHGAGQVPDPKFIASLRANADKLELRAADLIGKDPGEARKLLGQVTSMRMEAERLERTP